MTSAGLLPGFTFTQTALRTYQTCPYCFRLRYLEAVPWPTLALDPAAEAAMERGRRFHELACQHFLDLEVAAQAEAAGGELAAWWQALATAPPDLSLFPRRYPEAGLSIPLGDFRLAARYDLLAVGDAKALIVDWKTGRHLASAGELADDIQTRVYLYVLSVGGATYHAGRPFPPEALAILYWHPRGPGQVRLPYNAARQAEDRAFLEALIREIASACPESMRPAASMEPCASCAYAPLCGRPAASAPEWAEEETLFSEMETWPAE